MSRGAALGRVLAALREHGSHGQDRDGSSMWQCPADEHDDRTASLSVGQGKDGAVLFCQVCGQDATPQIVATLGLTLADLFDKPREPAGHPRDTRYLYHDETGNVLNRKTRYGDKNFAWHHPDGSGGWAKGLGGTRRVIYRLHEVAAAIRDGRTVFCVEGEKDANRLASMGETATSGPDGAAKGDQSAKWTPAYSDMLAGAAEVVIIADNDEAGIAHARATLAGITGKVGSARIVLGLATGKGADVSDHLNAGHKLADLVPLDEPANEKREPAESVDEPEPARRLVLTPASEIEAEPVVWAWEDGGCGRIPAGSIGLFAGREGTGKSSFLIWLAAQITRGSLPGAWYGSPRAVIYLAVEDSWKFTIVPRLIAAGADLDLVYRAEVKVIEGDTVSLCLPADLKLLEERIAEYGVAMVALDPLMSAISDALDTHVNRDVRRALDPMARMADRTGAVMAGIAHFNKSAGQDPSSLVTGSGAFKDVARFIFAFAADPESDAQVITQTKNSLGMSNLPSLDYRIIEAIVETPKGDARVGKFVPGGVSEKTVHDFLAAQAYGGERDAKTSAEDFLRRVLADGPKPSKDVEEEGKQAHGISKRTLDRARQALSIAVGKRDDGWYISLPEHAGDLRSPAKTAKAANSGTDGTDGRGGIKDAKDAKSPSPGELGTVGILPAASSRADGNRDLGYLAGAGTQTPRQPPCDSADPRHAACWELSDGWFLHDAQCVNPDAAA